MNRYEHFLDIEDLARDMQARDRMVRIASRSGHVPHRLKFAKQRDGLKARIESKLREACDG